MRIDKIHNRMDLIIDKAGSDYFSPGEKDDALDMASVQMFNRYLEKYGVDMDSREALKPFRVKVPYETDAEGKFSIADCARLFSANVMLMNGTVAKPVGLQIVREDEIDGRRQSQLKPITVEYPVLEILNETEYQIEPNRICGGEVVYLKRPTKPKFGYTEVDGEPVYNDGTSVQLEWNDKYVDRIIFAAVAILGVPITNEWLVQNGFTQANA